MVGLCLIVGALEHDKAIVCFQNFELVGWRVFSACVSEDASEPSALFFDGEEVVNFRLIGHIFCSVCISGLCIYILYELRTSRIDCRIENNRIG